MIKFFKYFFYLPFIAFSEDIFQKDQLSDHLSGLAPFIGKTFIGEFINSTPKNPIYDVIYWERILNGDAVQVTHSVNDGEFGGERIIIWDPEETKVVSWYFATGGLITKSIIDIRLKELISIEDVSKNNTSITKIKTIYKIMSNGDLNCKIKYFMNNVWVDAHELVYREVLNKKVIFK